VTFTCNVCGAICEHPPHALEREHKDCPKCFSSVRIRAMIALLSKELFGALLALPEFPVLKGIRGTGMSDAPELASRLAEKFDYTNTFYHQAPLFDVTNPDPHDDERFDFIISSEVMEHVPQPVERAFENLHRMLKPDGVLLLTTPYNLEGKTEEHFPELHEYSLASVGGRPVLVNRRRDGSVEVFENLVFHGGHGSTLEMRAFTEASLRAVLCGAGFRNIHFEAENVPEYGIEHAESWSLPVAARNGVFRAPSAELALQYREAMRLAARKIRDLELISAEYERHIAFHAVAHERWVQDAAARDQWTKRVEADWEQRTHWALETKKALDEAVAEFRNAKKSEEEAWGAVEGLSKKLERAEANLAELNASFWTRLGRKFRLL
jgi:SAM-dependent methyltransferase